MWGNSPRFGLYLGHCVVVHLDRKWLLVLIRVKWHDAKLQRMMWENLIDYLDDRMAAFSSIGKIPKWKISSLGCLTSVSVHTPSTWDNRKVRWCYQPLLLVKLFTCGSVCCEMLFTHTPSPSPNLSGAGFPCLLAHIFLSLHGFYIWFNSAKELSNVRLILVLFYVIVTSATSPNIVKNAYQHKKNKSLWVHPQN